MDLEVIIKQGERLGLVAEKLEQFVAQAIERDERAKKREDDKQQEARDLEKLRIEAKEASEKRKLDKEEAAEKRKIEAEEAAENRRIEQLKIEAEEAAENRRIEQLKIEREAEEAAENRRIEQLKIETEAKEKIEQLKIEADKEIELARINASRQINNKEDAENRNPKPTNYPKLPIFKESVDSMDSFLCRFEAHANAMHWPRNEWPVLLSTVLDGQALSIFHSLNTSGKVEYEKLKDCLLTKFQCDAEGFQTKFRKVTPDSKESFVAFGTRLEHLFDRWLELSKTERKFESLRELIISEQFLRSVTDDLTVFLRERNPSGLNEMIAMAENYRTAHPNKSLARQTTAAETTIVPTAFGASTYSEDIQNQYGYGPNNFQANRGSFRGGYRDSYRPGFRDRRGLGEERVKCQICGRRSHDAKICWYRYPENKDDDKKQNANPGGFCQSHQASTPGIVPTALAADYKDGQLEYSRGSVNGTPVTVVHDSGAVTAGVRKSLVRKDQYTGEIKKTWSFGGKIEVFPVAVVPITTEQYEGNISCCVIEEPFADLLVGNLEKITPQPGLFGNVVKDYNQDSSNKAKSTAEEKPTAAATTRAQSLKDGAETKPLKVPDPQLSVNSAELSKMQKEDKTITPCFQLAESRETKKSGKDAYSFLIQHGVLYRKFVTKGNTFQQIVVPESLRRTVLFTAHDTLLSGHCCSSRTMSRIRERFFWPGMSVDVRNYCRSCDACQKSQARGKTKDVPLEFMPRIDVPFKRIAIDLVGPLSPPSEEKHTHILSIIDVATRYPEAVPMKKIDSVSVAEALFTVFSRMGFPEEIQSDNGSQFTSEMMKEFQKLLSIKGVYISPYHSQANGVVERFHGTIKPMLRKIIAAQPRQWHRYLPALLFAVRELPNASTGFAPFELLFGRKPRGPIDLLANTWSGGEEAVEAKTAYQYVVDLKNHIYETCKIAHDAVDEARKTQKMYHDKKSMPRKFVVGDQVLLLLPTTANKLQMQWKGPYMIAEVSKNNYKITVGNKTRLYHANMLKKYFPRPTTTGPINTQIRTPMPQVKGKSPDGPTLKYDEIVSDDFISQYIQPTGASVLMAEDENPHVNIDTPSTSNQSSWKDINVDPELDPSQTKEITAVFEKFKTMMKDTPGASKGKVQHQINVTTDIPVRKKQYPLPFSARDEIIEETEELLKLGIIEPSTSPYCSPIVLVPKKDSLKKRMCLDLRGLNEITVFDSEPIPDQEEIFSKLTGAKYFTKIDLSKGYFQIFIKKEDRPKTAFQTPLGLMQFCRTPFGCVSAPATFARAMREILQGEAINFFDDILIASETWEKHVQDVHSILKKLSEGGFTIKPSKVYTGFQKLEFLGHLIGQGCLRPTQDKIDNILKLGKPRTKKQVRSLLGTMGYYKKFVPAYSSLTAPMSTLLAGRQKGPIMWTEECDVALKKIQDVLSSGPILKLPDLLKTFTVRTDASGAGVGGVLLQEHDGLLHPVAFASRKLLDRETRYSTIERECLGIVWTLTRFQRYLWGKEFHLETDHRPLQYLTSASYKNPRIMRWSLALQEFRYSIKALPGEKNVLADIMSRSDIDQTVPNV